MGPEMRTKTLESASVLWEYMASFRTVTRCDAIVVCCSYDLRVCDYACSLIESNPAGTLVLSGRSGNWTRHLWNVPECQVFRERAIRNGVSADRILLEDRATNLGENVRFSRELLATATTATFVTKPSTVLRLKLTIEAQWPDIEAHVTCPEIRFPDEVCNAVGIIGVIQEMVGDVQRIQRYPQRGYQAPHRLPAHVLDAWNYLIHQGFVHHLG